MMTPQEQFRDLSEAPGLGLDEFPDALDAQPISFDALPDAKEGEQDPYGSIENAPVKAFDSLPSTEEDSFSVDQLSPDSFREKSQEQQVLVLFEAFKLGKNVGDYINRIDDIDELRALQQHFLTQKEHFAIQYLDSLNNLDDFAMACTTIRRSLENAISFIVHYERRQEELHPPQRHNVRAFPAQRRTAGTIHRIGHFPGLDAREAA